MKPTQKTHGELEEKDAMAEQRAPIEEIQREASSPKTASQGDSAERTSAQTQNP